MSLLPWQRAQRNQRYRRALERPTICACGAALVFETDRNGCLVERCPRCRARTTVAARNGDSRITFWRAKVRT